MTPKLSQMRSKGPGMFENLRKSKMSEAELKDEIIKDLTDQKKVGSKKRLQRNVSSQFTNYAERRMSNSRIGK